MLKAAATKATHRKTVMHTPMRQRQLEQLRLSLSSDAPWRCGGAALAIGLTAYTLESPLLLLWLVPFAISEITMHRMLRRSPTSRPVRDIELAALCVISSVAFLSPALALWLSSDVYAMVATLLYICAGLLNVSVVRAASLVAALSSVAVYLVLLLYLAWYFYVDTGDLMGLMAGLAGIFGMCGYVVVTIVIHNTAVRRLLSAEVAAQSASEAKSAALAALSHEIRTPLNGILGVGQLLSEKPELRNDPTYFALLLKSGRSLRTLLNDALDMARAEAGEMPLAPVSASLRRDVAEACRLFAPIAERKGLSLQWDVAKLPERAEYDACRLRQVLRNLISNAVKYTADGHVTVVATVEKADEARFVRVEVADTGPGFEASLLQRPFKPFRRGAVHDVAKTDGTGLGLSITETLVESAGGRLHVCNAAEGGARVTVWLPISVVSERRSTPPVEVFSDRSGVLDGACVLVVDDIATNRFIAQRLLELAGLVVREASSGEEALDIIASDPPDALLVDIHMPGMSGHDVIDHLAASEARKTLAIVAMTADAMEDDRSMYLNAGFDGYVAKPLDHVALIDQLQKALEKRRPYAATPERLLNH